MKLFDEKFYICETCHKYLYENDILCQAVCNKMALHTTSDELKDLERSEKVLISKKMFFKKIALIHGKGKFFKIKGNIYNILIEATSICYILMSTVYNGLIVVNLKQNFKYRGKCIF